METIFCCPQCETACTGRFFCASASCAMPICKGCGPGQNSWVRAFCTPEIYLQWTTSLMQFCIFDQHNWGLQKYGGNFPALQSYFSVSPRKTEMHSVYSYCKLRNCLLRGPFGNCLSLLLLNLVLEWQFFVVFMEPKIDSVEWPAVMVHKSERPSTLTGFEQKKASFSRTQEVARIKEFGSCGLSRARASFVYDLRMDFKCSHAKINLWRVCE